jgi:hypothetical protein
MVSPFFFQKARITFGPSATTRGSAAIQNKDSFARLFELELASIACAFLLKL